MGTVARKTGDVEKAVILLRLAGLLFEQLGLEERVRAAEDLALLREEASVDTATFDAYLRRAEALYLTQDYAAALP